MVHIGADGSLRADNWHPVATLRCLLKKIHMPPYLIHYVHMSQDSHFSGNLGVLVFSQNILYSWQYGGAALKPIWGVKHTIKIIHSLLINLIYLSLFVYLMVWLQPWNEPLAGIQSSTDRHCVTSLRRRWRAFDLHLIILPFIARTRLKLKNSTLSQLDKYLGGLSNSNRLCEDR